MEKHKLFTEQQKGKVGFGDVSVCQKKNLVTMIPCFESKISYHLVDYNNMRVCRRAAWHKQLKGNAIDDFDVNPEENI